MKIYEADNEKEMVENMINTLEKETKQKIFTLAITGVNDEENFLETLVVFEDKSILSGRIFVTEVKGNLAFRLQGNFI